MLHKHSPQIKKILNKLNPAQQRAVTYGDGPLLIIAGAGTGKTRVITYKIAYLIATKKAMPSEILALTFTEKAANEMSFRVDVLVPYGFNDVWISTFHSFGDKILRENASLLGISVDYRVLTQPASFVFFSEHLFKFQMNHFRPLGNPSRYVNSLLNTISRAKDEDISPDEYLKWAETLDGKAANPQEKELAGRHVEIAGIYSKYEELKRQHNLVDFGDQVILPLKLLRDNPAAASKYRSQYKYILIDEFQDTNYAQFELAKILAGTAESPGNITAVGDDDQSIYKFRGACLSNIIGFKDFYKGCGEIVLTQNYRSTQNILNSAYRLIVHNNPERLEVKHRIKKILKSDRKIPGRPVVHLCYDTVYTEADNVAKIIKKKKGKYAWRDFAILVRSNNMAKPFMKSLNAEGIPWRSSGGTGLIDRNEIRYIIAFLRALANPDDSRSMYYLISCATGPFKNAFPIVPDVTGTIALCNLAKKYNRSLYYVLNNLDKYGETATLSTELKQGIKRFTDAFNEYLHLSVNRPTGQLLYEFLKRQKTLEALARAETADDIEQAQNIAAFFQIITNFDEISEYNRVVRFVEYIDSLFEGIEAAGQGGQEQLPGEFEPDYDAVNILTIHKAKGLEFRAVFLVGLVEDKFPTRSMSDPITLPDGLIKDILPAGDYHQQEERRLFYVGMTRSKDELYLTSAYNYGGKKIRKISRFVHEATDVPLVDVKILKPSVIEQIHRYAPPAGGAEKKFVLPDTLSLSPYAIDDYLTCPLKYRYVHIIKIPLPKHHTLVFGAIIHKVLNEYHCALKENRELSLEGLLRLYDGMWTSEGFLSREHEEKRILQGREMLTNYYKGQVRDREAPSGVEEEFRFLLDNKITVRGRWDRLDLIDGESTIIDYKTSGGIIDEEDALAQTKKSRQLMIYALGYREKYGRLPDWVALYFLEPGILSRIKISDKKIDKALDDIRTVADGIRSGSFHAKPGYFSCDFCPYRSICSVTPTTR